MFHISKWANMRCSLFSYSSMSFRRSQLEQAVANVNTALGSVLFLRCFLAKMQCVLWSCPRFSSLALWRWRRSTSKQKGQQCMFHQPSICIFCVPPIKTSSIQSRNKLFFLQCLYHLWRNRIPFPYFPCWEADCVTSVGCSENRGGLVAQDCSTICAMGQRWSPTSIYILTLARLNSMNPSEQLLEKLLGSSRIFRLVFLMSFTLQFYPVFSPLSLGQCTNENPQVCIIGILLLPKLTQLNRETNQIVMR